jgi:plastocyanin
MTPFAHHVRTPYRVPRVMAFLGAIVTLAALPSSSTAPPSSVGVASPDVTPSSAPSTPSSPAPSPSAAIVKVTPIPGAPDSKVTVAVVAVHTRWDPTTLNAPAGKVWHVKIDDQDAGHHNFTVASGKSFEERIFQVKNFVKGTYTVDIPALPAGNYLFICTIHPDAMTGTLTIK